MPHNLLTVKQGIAGSVSSVSKSVAVAATMLIGWCGSSAAAADLDIRLSAFVPAQCSGTISLKSASPKIKAGAVTTFCNTPYSIALAYPSELGAISVTYQGQVSQGSGGFVTLAERAPPSAGVSGIQIEVENEALADGFALIIAPQGL